MTLSEVLQYINVYAQHYLKDAPLEYLTNERQLTPETIKTFELGYFPGFGKKLLAKVDREVLKEHNLIRIDGTSEYDGRITFPFYDQYGQLVAITARTIQPVTTARKYWHNPFSKGSYLYGLYYSKPYIRKQRLAYVCEGQVDFLTSWQFDIRNIVCSSGTAFTPYQIALLSRYAEEVVLVFDADVAGRKASEKIFSQKRAGVKFRPLILSQGVTKEDLDSFLKKKGPEAFRALSNIKKESIGLQEYVAQLG